MTNITYLVHTTISGTGSALWKEYFGSKNPAADMSASINSMPPLQDWSVGLLITFDHHRFLQMGCLSFWILYPKIFSQLRVPAGYFYVQSHLFTSLCQIPHCAMPLKQEWGFDDFM